MLAVAGDHADLGRASARWSSAPRSTATPVTRGRRRRRRRDGRAARRRAAPEPRADGRGRPGVRPRRAVRATSPTDATRSSPTGSALKLGDYVVTEAGFGFDIGGEKFLDIKCRIGGIAPSAASRRDGARAQAPRRGRGRRPRRNGARRREPRRAPPTRPQHRPSSRRGGEPLPGRPHRRAARGRQPRARARRARGNRRRRL